VRAVYDRSVRIVRNIAIIALLAVPIAFVPGGGEAADGIITALVLGFLAAIGWLGYRLYRENQFTLSTLPDSRLALLYGALGVIALMIAGQDELTGSAAGILLWIVLLGAAAGTIFWVWREAHSY
jgi:hypothetical protein